MRRYLGCPECTNEFKNTRPWRFAYCCQCRDPNGPEPVEAKNETSEKNFTGPSNLGASEFALGSGLPPNGGFFAGSLFGPDFGATPSTSNSTSTFKSLLEKNRIDLFKKGENGLLPLFPFDSLENSTTSFNLRGLNSTEAFETSRTFGAAETTKSGGLNTLTITTLMEERNTAELKEILGKQKFSAENSFEVDKLLQLFGNSEILVILPQGSIDKAKILSSHNVTTSAETLKKLAQASNISNFTASENMNVTGLPTVIAFKIQGNQTSSAAATNLELSNGTIGLPILQSEQLLPALPSLNRTDTVEI